MSTPTPALPPAVAEALAKGRILEAIKLLRQQPGLGLREAKEMVEAAAAARAAPHAGNTTKHAPAAAPPKADDPLAGLNGRAPGEVPPSGDWTIWALVIALMALAALLLIR